MDIFRRLGIGVATLIFGALLTVLPPLIGLYIVFSKPEPLKNALRQSGIYQSAASIIIDKQAGQQDPQLALNNAAIRKAVIDAFPPAYLQNTAERNIDSTYLWIHGDTAEPQLRIDTEQPRQLLAQNIGEAAKQKLVNLPVCKERRSAPATPAELMALECKPPNIADLTLVEAAREQVLTSGLFARTTEQMGTLKNENGRPITGSLQAVPKAYQYLLWSLFIIPAVLILTAIAIIWWSPTRRRGLKRIGTGLVTNGIISSLLAIGAVWAIGYISRLFVDKNTTLVTLQSKLLEAIEGLATQIRNWWLVVSIGYIVIGIALLVIAKRRQANQTEHNKSLNESLGYRDDVPAAGTMFGADDKTSAEHSAEQGQIPTPLDTSQHNSTSETENPTNQKAPTSKV